MATPNIVFIAVDDLFAYDKFRTAFGVTIQTPNLDRLTAQATSFDAAYAHIPVCGPSRAATMSGESAWRSGVHSNLDRWTDHIPPAETFPALLKEAGYYSAAAGKVFHESDRMAPAVADALYSERQVSTADRLSQNFTDTGGYWHTWSFPDETEDFHDAQVADFGVDFLQRHTGEQPFLLSLGFKHPHSGYEAPQRYYDLYDQSAIRIPENWAFGDLADVPGFAQQFVTDGALTPQSDFAAWQATVEAYLASISHADAMIGRFLDALDASPYAADTAVMLYSDHGYHLGDKNHFHKFTLWEEAARAPLILRAPGAAQGARVDTPVSFLDIYPTILELAGVIDGPARPDGQSLLPLVGLGQGAYDALPVLTTAFGATSVRTGDHRLIRYTDGTEELYDVVADPAQTVNLAGDPAHAATQAAARADLFAAAQRQGVIMDNSGPDIAGGAGEDVAIVQPINQRVALGDGDDTYFVHARMEAVVEQAGGGRDLIMASGFGPLVMPDHVEDLTHATQTALAPDGRRQAVDIRGNALDNQIVVYNANAVVRGGDGHDRIFAGYWSANTLYGDAGHDRIVGGRWNDDIDGGTGADNLSGGRGNDRLWGRDGADTLEGGLGADRLDGGAGLDVASYAYAETAVTLDLRGAAPTVTGEGAGDAFLSIERFFLSAHADVAIGGDGRDDVEGQGGDDRLWGFAAPDRLLGQGGADFIAGGAGEDTLQGGAGADTLMGEGEADWMAGEAGADWMAGGAGADTLTGGDDADTLVGDDGADWLLGEAGADVLYGGAGDDHAYGGAGDDWVRGDAGADRLRGADGADTLLGEAGADTLEGGAGDDWLGGGDDADTLRGEAGSDILRGGGGGDRLEGGAGRDALGGGDGADTLEGGADGDWLWGGAGADVFVIAAGALQAGDVDRIMDMADGAMGVGDGLRFDGVRYEQLIWYEQGTSAVVQIALDGGGSAYVEILNFTLGQLGDQYDFGG